MFNHEPADYKCVFCQLIAGVESANNRIADIVYQNELVIASVAPRWWPNNYGALLIIPKIHYENIYDMPDNCLAEIGIVSKKIALAIRQTYPGCEGISTRQHNEPAGDQDVWHFHTHVLPRYPNDNLYKSDPVKDYFPAEDRAPYAQKTREFLMQPGQDI